MQPSIPRWALRPATAGERGEVLDAHRLGRAQIRWPDRKKLRDWARRQGWPAPRFGFEAAFLGAMLETEENFRVAREQSGIEVFVPKRDFTISLEKIGELDALYEERSAACQATGWGVLVEELREIRRAVGAGVEVKIEGERALRTGQEFYDWAHGRYRALGDGTDEWIGGDES